MKILILLFLLIPTLCFAEFGSANVETSECTREKCPEAFEELEMYHLTEREYLEQQIRQYVASIELMKIKLDRMQRRVQEIKERE